MFELTISTGIDKQQYINKLQKQLSAEIKRCGGIVIKQNYQGRCYFSFAVDKAHKEYFKSKVLDWVVFVVIDDYKFSYYSGRLSKSENNMLFEPFVKAISIFDADCDKEIIKQQIDFSGEILVDSFYYFKLQCLVQRWQKTADIIASNRILSSEQAIIDVLKYLTTMSDNMVVKTDINITSKQIRLKKLGQTKCYKKNQKGLSNFLAEIICINPGRINLKFADAFDMGCNEQMLNILNGVFSDKIYLLN